MRSITLAIVTAIAPTPGLLAQTPGTPSLQFPFGVVAQANGAVVVSPNRAELRQLADLGRVTLTNVPAPGRGVVQLSLRRVPLHLGPNALWVDGAPSTEGVDPTLSLWCGEVVDQPESDVFLSFSEHGSRGWFGVAGHFDHLLAEPGPNGDWTRSRCRIVTADFIEATGARPELSCRVMGHPFRGANTRGLPTPMVSGNARTIIDTPISFETDYEYYALFNNLRAAQNYAFALIGAVSNRYREQMDIIWTLPYIGFHTTNTDPWTATDCFARLSEFRAAWQNGGAPAPAALYHMLSGVRVTGCGGVAAGINLLCNQRNGFAMSAHINGRLPFPPAQGPLTWDFYVLAHETGHQFGSPHTHSYAPVIDRCDIQSPCITNGTNMSYCHGCPGGMRNITLRFHTRVAALIRRTVELANRCLKPFDGIITKDLGLSLTGSNGTPEQSLDYSSPTVTVNVSSAPTDQPGVVVIGFSKVYRPMFGWFLLPDPLIALPSTSNASGDLSATFSVPGSYPTGITAYLHSWIYDPAGPWEFAVSNGTELEVIKP